MSFSLIYTHEAVESRPNYILTYKCNKRGSINVHLSWARSYFSITDSISALWPKPPNLNKNLLLNAHKLNDATAWFNGSIISFF